MITDPSVLLRRLNPYCARALEAAASLCQTRAHPEITLEHWLLKLLEQGCGDMTVIARRYELDLDGVWQALLGQLEYGTAKAGIVWRSTRVIKISLAYRLVGKPGRFRAFSPYSSGADRQPSMAESP